MLGLSKEELLKLSKQVIEDLHNETNEFYKKERSTKGDVAAVYSTNLFVLYNVLAMVLDENNKKVEEQLKGAGILK